MTIAARVLLFVVLCLVGGFDETAAATRAATAPAAPVPAPIGLDADGTAFALLSNKGWTLANGRPAREVKVIRRAIPGSLDVRGRQDEAYIWAETCTPQAQQIVFRRVFFLPGPAKTFGAIFEATNSNSANTRPIGSFRLKINGRLVLNVAGSAMNLGRHTIAEAANNYAKAIQYGNNVVEVEVSKVAQSAANNKCLEASTLLGFHFDIYGSFEADLFLSKTPNVIQDCYHKAGGPAKGMSLLVFKRFGSLQNLGPSGSYRPHLSIKVTATQSEQFAVSNYGAMGMTCETVVASKTSWFLECDIDPWPAGLSPGIRFVAAAKLALIGGVPPSKPYFQVKAILSSKTGDPNYNHKDEFRAHLCQPSSTDPNCTTPKACSGASVTQ